MRLRSVSMLGALVLLLAACGSDPEPAQQDPASAEASEAFSTPFAGAEAYPVFVSSEIVVGENRFLIGVLDDNDAPLGSPGIEVKVAFFDLEASTEDPVAEEDTEFVWIVEEQGRGLYVAHPTFDSAGEWGAEVTISGEDIDETLRGSFTVAEASTTPAVGDKVPASATPTAASPGDLKDISTDDDPDPRFYETSIASAVKRGKPFVAVFATPKFCTSAVCGPTLDEVKKVADDFPAVTFIHTEIYEENDPTKPPLKSVVQWGLPSEPWVFIVGSDGRLVAKFEGSAPAQELRPVLEGLR